MDDIKFYFDENLDSFRAKATEPISIAVAEFLLDFFDQPVLYDFLINPGKYGNGLGSNGDIFLYHRNGEFWIEGEVFLDKDDEPAYVSSVINVDELLNIANQWKDKKNRGSGL